MDFPCQIYCVGALCTKEHKQSCTHWHSCLFVDLPSPICFPPTLQISKRAPGLSDVPRVQVAERRASGKRLLVCLVKSMRDCRWTCRILGQARRRRGHMEGSVWKLKLQDDNKSSEITSLQELPAWIQGDHITGHLVLLASNCLETDVLDLRNWFFFFFLYSFFFFFGEGIILSLKLIDW